MIGSSDAPASSLTTVPRRHPLLASATLIGLASLAMYLPFRGRTLYNTDSVGFANAIHSFNLSAHQPQSPGYPLYVATLRVVERLSRLSDNDTIVVVSVGASVLAVVCFYLLVRSWLNGIEAILLAALLLSSPAVWFNAEIAMSYSVALSGSVVVALLAYHARQRGGVLLWALPLAWGVAAGFRPELMAMLGPLVLYAVWPSVRRSPRIAPILVVLGGVGIALWLVPLIYVTGGVLTYARLFRGHSASAFIPYWFLAHVWSIGARLMVWNVVVAIAYLAIGSLGVLPMQVLRLRSSRWLAGATGIPRGFAITWLVPGFLVDVVTTVGHSGYVLAYLPPLLLLLWPRMRRRIVIAASTLGIAVQAVYFLAAPQIPGVFAGSWLYDTLYRRVGTEATRSRLVQDDALAIALVNEIERHYPANQTLLIVPVGDEPPRNAPIHAMYAQARYYLPDWNVKILYTTRLPDFDALHLPPYVTADVFRDQFILKYTRVVAPPPGYRIRWLVWFCDVDSNAYPFNAGWERYRLPSGVTLIVGDLSKSYPGIRTWGPFEFPTGGAIDRSTADSVTSSGASP